MTCVFVTAVTVLLKLGKIQTLLLDAHSLGQQRDESSATLVKVDVRVSPLCTTVAAVGEVAWPRITLALILTDSITAVCGVVTKHHICDSCTLTQIADSTFFLRSCVS